jgi:hypothetical protein
MLATLAFATALSMPVAQDKDGELKVSNPRTTYGILGAPRGNDKYLPGDMVFLAYDISGMTVGKDGQIRYTLSLELKDPTGKKIYSERPQAIVASNSLGGNSLPSFSYAEVGTNTAPGKYTMTVTVRDETAKKAKPVEITQNFEVLKKDFGIGRLDLFYDERGSVWAPRVFVAGQQAWIHFITLGFDRDANGDPNVEVRIQVLDESGKPTLPQPYKGEVKKAERNQSVFPWYQKLDFNRPGKFKIELEAEDKVAKKTVKEVQAITVLGGK